MSLPGSAQVPKRSGLAQPMQRMSPGPARATVARRGIRQPLKLMRGIKSCWRKAAPLAGRLLPGVRAWGRFQADGPPDLRVSRLRAALAGRARLQGPSQLMSPHQTGLTATTSAAQKKD